MSRRRIMRPKAAGLWALGLLGGAGIAQEPVPVVPAPAAPVADTSRARPGEAWPSFTADGAWCWFADPRALACGGRTVAGWVTAQGDVVVGALDHASGEVRKVTVHAALDRDDHANPALWWTPGGRLAVFYSEHAGKAIRLRSSEGTEDPLLLGPVRELTLNRGAFARKSYCYPNPAFLAETGELFLFWRGDDWKPTFSVSRDAGETWTEGRIALARKGAGSNNRPYVKVASDGRRRLHLAFTDGHPRNEPTNSIYHAAWEDGRFRRADGEAIAGLDELPFEPGRADCVYDGKKTGVRAWIWDVAADAEGRPVLVYARLPAEDDHRYHYARFTGKGWEDHELCRAGGWFPQTPAGEKEREGHYSAGIVLDPADPGIVYLARPVAGVFEIERWTTRDGGATWTAEAITRGSRHHNVRPVVVRGHGDAGPRVLWMNLHGGYVHYTRFATAICMDLAR